MHPAETYVGWAYNPATADCADLVVQVQREMFGRDVSLPNGRPRGERGQAVMASVVREIGRRTDNPKDGDLVLMREPGQSGPGHAGVYFHTAHEGWVLHATDRLGGVANFHRVRDLPCHGCFIEGFYEWA